MTEINSADEAMHLENLIAELCPTIHHVWKKLEPVVILYRTNLKEQRSPEVEAKFGLIMLEMNCPYALAMIIDYFVKKFGCLPFFKEFVLILYTLLLNDKRFWKAVFYSKIDIGTLQTVLPVSGYIPLFLVICLVLWGCPLYNILKPVLASSALV